MLPADRRLRRSQEFARVVRGGRRSGSRTLVVHLLEGGAGSGEAARVGFVVGRGVGGSVVRSQVSRRLRHLVRARLSVLPAGSLVVVRALAPAATASSAVLGAELDRAFTRLGLEPAAAPVGGAA